MQFIVFGVLLLAAGISADLRSDVSDILKEFPRPAGGNPNHINHVEQLKKFLESPLIEEMIAYLKNRGVDVDSLFSSLTNNPDLHLTPFNSQDWTTESTLRHIIEVMSSPKILGVIEEKMSDPEFAHFVAVVQEPEFKAMFYRAMNSKPESFEHEKNDLSMWQRIKWSIHWG